MSTEVERAPALLPGQGVSSASFRMLPVHALDALPPAEGAGLRALFESILQWGILQPLIVRRAGVRYEVLAGRKRFAAAVAAGLGEVPCLVIDVPDADAPAVAAATNTVAPVPAPAATHVQPLFLSIVAELQATRAAIAGCVALADSRTPGLRQHVARELVDVELQRSAWMMDGLLLMKPGGPEHRTTVAVGPLLRGVASAFRPECRLGGIDVQLHVDPADLVVQGEEAQLRAAVHCVAGALLSALHGDRHPEAVLSLTARTLNDAPVISVAQNVVPFQRVARLRAGRRAEQDGAEPGLTAFGLEAAKRVAESHGGRLELRSDQSGGGCIVDLKLPTG